MQASVSDITCTGTACEVIVTVTVDKEPEDGVIDAEVYVEEHDLDFYDWLDIAQESGEFTLALNENLGGACEPGSVSAEVYVDVLDNANCGDVGQDDCHTLGVVDRTSYLDMVCN